MRNSAHHFSYSVLARLSAPSTPESVIEKAIEKAEAGDKVVLADVKQWKEAAQSASQRAEEFRQESNARHKKIRELEQQVDLLKAEKPEPEVRIEAPKDYEATKEQVGFASPMQSAYLLPMLAIGTCTGRQGYGIAQSHRCIARRGRESFHYRQGREKRAIVHHHE